MRDKFLAIVVRGLNHPPGDPYIKILEHEYPQARVMFSFEGRSITLPLTELIELVKNNDL